jgi:hypothetical protein
MWNCASLSSVDLSGLTELETIGDNFLNGCTNLTSIDLSGLIQLESIDDYFLNKCVKLKSIDLTPLKNIKNHDAFGHNFLRFCSPSLIITCNYLQLNLIKSLCYVNLYDEDKQVDFFPDDDENLNYFWGYGSTYLRDSKDIKTQIVYKYNFDDNKVKSIDLKPLNCETIINDNFLSDFNNLTEIDLSHLSKVKNIGNNFLFNCSKLINIDLTPLINLTSIGNNFLDGCDKLEKIKFTQSQMRMFIQIDRSDYYKYSTE